MHIDRIDFTDGAECHFCGRRLQLGIAHIVRFDDGSEMPAGPRCARKHALTEEFPDFTKAAAFTDEEAEEGDAAGVAARGHLGGRPTRREASGRIRAVTWLRLRQEKMIDFPAVPFRPLEPIYARFRDGKLSEADIAYIHRLMGMVEGCHPLLTLRSLQTAYAYHRLLRRAVERIDPESRRAYLRDLAEYLRIHLCLSPGQIAAANRWLEHLGHERLRPCAQWDLPAHRQGLIQGRSGNIRSARPVAAAAEDNA